MTPVEALAILRDKGTLRVIDAADSINRAAMNSPTALAVSVIVTQTRAHSRGAAWLAPSNLIAPLP